MTRPAPAPVLVDVYAAAAHARLTHHMRLAPATIRQWVRRGHLTRHPHNAGGLAQVDLNELDHRLTTHQPPRRRACRAGVTSPRRGRRGQPPAGGQPMQPQLVQYMLNDDDVQLITAQHRNQLDAGTMNAPSAGETYPAVVVRTFSTCVNLQVLLDGSGTTYWATSRQPGTGPGTWSGHHEQAPAVMRYFAYAHLPEPLQQISALFSTLAHELLDRLPNDLERTVALRKILEAKDAAVRLAAAHTPGLDR